jgi:hypothetical protein
VSQLLHKLNVILMSVIKYIYLNSSSISINSHLISLYMMNDPCTVQIHTIMIPTNFSTLGSICWYHFFVFYTPFTCVFVIIVTESLNIYVPGFSLLQFSINMDDCSSSVLTLCYDNLDYECRAELLENPLEHILDDTDPGLEEIMCI